MTLGKPIHKSNSYKLLSSQEQPFRSANREIEAIDVSDRDRSHIVLDEASMAFERQEPGEEALDTSLADAVSQYSHFESKRKMKNDG